jgi:hypothetical protein
LKVDAGKLPVGIRFFKCPACEKGVPVSLLEKGSGVREKGDDAETVVVRGRSKKGVGTVTVVADKDNGGQVLVLKEGINVIGRKSSSSQATTGIETEDLSMSREHIRIEVEKDEKGGYKHYLWDNKSRNRTFYKGRYLAEGEVAELSDKDEMVIGNTVLRFHV